MHDLDDKNKCECALRCSTIPYVQYPALHEMHTARWCSLLRSAHGHYPQCSAATRYRNLKIT